MPFKSKAQQRFMHAAAERGEIPKKVVKEFDKSTDFSSLPEHVKNNALFMGKLVRAIGEECCTKKD
jgi:hypothetical protein